ncbi:hypothetical protein [Kitasatospora sp. NPDC093558]|uniref:hypothetical protein n=1 Tax=Kitasatospora sp. NPDC093558 TaxID=3155201 RepID=UPI00343C23A6
MSIASLAACGPSSSSSSSSASSAPASQVPAAPTTSAPASKPAAGSGDPAAAAGGANAITVTGETTATYKFPAGSCLGEKSASGKLTLVAATQDGDASVALAFDGNGSFSVLLTAGINSANSVIWTGESPVGASASRTGDTVTFTNVPISQITPGHDGKASGSVKCESVAALL